MGLVNEYTTVGLNSSVINYYENLGYEIPKSKDKEGRLRIPRGTTIEVKVSDLREVRLWMVKMPNVVMK